MHTSANAFEMKVGSFQSIDDQKNVHIFNHAEL